MVNYKTHNSASQVHVKLNKMCTTNMNKIRLQLKTNKYESEFSWWSCY